jgi:hypothetical protein
MKLELKSLKLLCKKTEELIDFGERISFFHGEMSSGKSTIVEMVNFCLGGKLVKTPAVTSEVIKVQLTLAFSEKLVLFERAISSTSIDVSWNEAGEFFLERLPTAAAVEPIIGNDIYNLSDFILNCLGVAPIKVRQRKSDENSELRRVSFRDFYRLCYLDQRHLDSSLFNLDNPITGEKSKDVMKYILGFQSDQLLVLQRKLQEQRQQQRFLRDASKQISNFLKNYGFASEREIDQQVEEINLRTDVLENERTQQTAVD